MVSSSLQSETRETNYQSESFSDQELHKSESFSDHELRNSESFSDRELRRSEESLSDREMRKSESFSDREMHATRDTAETQSDDAFGEFEDIPENQSGARNAAVDRTYLEQSSRQNASHIRSSYTSSDSEDRSKKHNNRSTSAERNTTRSDIQVNTYYF